MKYYHLRYPWGSAWTGMMLFCGNKNILTFLDHCTQTVRNYDDFLRTLPPELPAKEAAKKLRTKFGVTTTPIDPASAVLTVNAHRNFPL